LRGLFGRISASVEVPSGLLSIADEVIE